MVRTVYSEELHPTSNLQREYQDAAEPGFASLENASRKADFQKRGIE